ncbi:MAG: helix-turn-helix domain-containing protein [Mycobacteriaceae bacterium]
MTSQTHPKTVVDGWMLRALREGAGMSLRTLADTLGDTTHGHIGRIETGERTPTPELANRIIHAIASHLAQRPAA